MAGIGTRVVGLGNHHTSRTEAGTVRAIDWDAAEHADESPTSRSPGTPATPPGSARKA